MLYERSFNSFDKFVGLSIFRYAEFSQYGKASKAGLILTTMSTNLTQSRRLCTALLDVLATPESAVVFSKYLASIAALQFRNLVTIQANTLIKYRLFTEGVGIGQSVWLRAGRPDFDSRQG
jgi:hypothetical protein